MDGWKEGRMDGRKNGFIKEWIAKGWKNGRQTGP